MALTWATAALALLGLYSLAGLLLGLALIARGLPHIDPAAQGMPWSARLLLLPGLVALWPLMLQKWLRQQPPPQA